jgi:hypothetical protein
MVSSGIEETNEVWGQEHLSRRLAPGCGFLTGFREENSLRLGKIIGGRGDLGGSSRQAMVPCRLRGQWKENQQGKKQEDTRA